MHMLCVDDLKLKLELAQRDLETMSPEIKNEPMEDNPFKEMIDAFAKETSEKPMTIEDSP